MSLRFYNFVLYSICMRNTIYNLEHLNCVYYINTQNGCCKIIIFSNLDLLAIKLACIMTDRSFSEIIQTPQFNNFLQEVNEKYTNIYKILDFAN